MNSVVSANIMTSQFTVEQILQLCETSLDESSIFISSIFYGIHGAMMANLSPFLPLITAEIDKYSLQYGISEESTIAFANYASMKARSMTLSTRSIGRRVLHILVPAFHVFGVLIFGSIVQ
jgi:hypothetical protein